MQLSFLRTRPPPKQAGQLVNMTIINDFFNDVSNFLKKSPRDMCEVSNWISFFQRFQKLCLIQHLINFYFLWVLLLLHIYLPKKLEILLRWQHFVEFFPSGTTVENPGPLQWISIDGFKASPKHLQFWLLKIHLCISSNLKNYFNHHDCLSVCLSVCAWVNVSHFRGYVTLW